MSLGISQRRARIMVINVAVRWLPAERNRLANLFLIQVGKRLNR